MTLMPDPRNPWIGWQLSVYTGILGGMVFWAAASIGSFAYAFAAGAAVAVWMLLFLAALDSKRRPDGSGGWLRWQRIDHQDGSPYLRRLHLLPWNPHINVYLHRFAGSDDGRGMHDHPFDSISLCLSGLMVEHMPHNHPDRERGIAPEGDAVRHVRPGSIRFRGAGHVHMLELVSERAITLFVTGPRVRDWGFWIDGEWIPSKELYARRRP